MVPVRLTAEEADDCDAVAAQQAHGARRAGRRDAWGVGLEQSLHGHRVGARGERAFAKWAGLPWEPSYVPQGTGPDVGPYEIKTASVGANSYRDTLTIPAARLVRARVYVAVRAWTRHDHDLVGWITGAEVQDLWPAQERFGRWEHVIPYGVLHELEDLP